jgi:ATP-dependent Clp protease ATP-binding subunit ClpA
LLVAAKAEALGFDHNVLGSEHALLALAEADRPAGDVLRSLGVGPDEVRAAVIRDVGEGPRPIEGTRRDCVDPGSMSLSPHLKRVLQVSAGVTPPGLPIRPEHLLIAVTRVPEAEAARILAERGIDEAAIVNAFIRLDGGDA